DAVGCLIRASGDLLEVALVIDDRDDVIHEGGHANAWREWLRISNALNLREQPTWIITVSEVLAHDIPQPARTAVGDVPKNLAPEWQAIRDLTLEGRERHLVEQLAQDDSIPVPVLGYETEGGIPIDFAWPEAQVAVCFDEDDRAELGANGWRVF